jgi:MFS family permease
VYLSGSIGNMPLFLLASMVSGFGGGAIFPLFAAMTADYFGENNNATNYGLVYSSKVISGLVGAGLGSVVVSTWGYGTAFVIAGSVGIACAVITLFLRQPKLGQVPGSTSVSPQDRVKRGHPEEASLALD